MMARSTEGSSSAGSVLHPTLFPLGSLTPSSPFRLSQDDKGHGRKFRHHKDDDDFKVRPSFPSPSNLFPPSPHPLSPNLSSSSR
ncbi:hypothetical protein BCR35DRAFT_298718 [Leucosporidium creatinivorum]|uniref:Uncharacterized protein n=1 Tax=Leucosporidium creatinivorum TaxID=106004 RepID=A0A1Y2G2D8_9BASI|nr:hypothetical protein BCR35DRAFT_298718 [Leucosporidium creatinivorum]